MKSKVSVESLSELKFAEYRRLAAKELKRMEALGPDQPLQFICMTKFIYSDNPGKKLPFLVVGKFANDWKQYFKTTVLKRKERDFSIGTVTLDNEGTMQFDVKKGKLKGTDFNMLEKVFLKPLKLQGVLASEGSDEQEDESDDAPAAAAPQAAAPVASPAKEAALAKAKEQVKEQAQSLNEPLANYKAAYAAVSSKILPRLKKGGAANFTDMAQLSKAIEAYDEFMGQYKESPKPIQKAFAAAQGKLKAQGKELLKVAKAAKNKKQSLAEQLTNEFFKRQGIAKAASPKEVALMQMALKTAMKETAVNEAPGAEKQNKLKSIFLTAKLRGPKFKVADVQKVAARLAQ